MDLDRLVNALGSLPFRQAVWLFPLATALRFLEEAPQFANWASKYAFKSFTRKRWRRIHGVGLLLHDCFLCSCFVVPKPTPRFPILRILSFGERAERLLPCGGNRILRCLLPRTHHRAVLYPPLFWHLSQLAHEEGLLTNRLGISAVLIAVVVHSLDVTMSVFGGKSET